MSLQLPFDASGSPPSPFSTGLEREQCPGSQETPVHLSGDQGNRLARAEVTATLAITASSAVCKLSIHPTRSLVALTPSTEALMITTTSGDILERFWKEYMAVPLGQLELQIIEVSLKSFLVNKSERTGTSLLTAIIHRLSPLLHMSSTMKNSSEVNGPLLFYNIKH